MYSEILKNPKLYVEILIDGIKDLGILTIIVLILIFFLMKLIYTLFTATIESYQNQIKVINDQNKKYQEAMLGKLKSSENKHLGEK